MPIKNPTRPGRIVKNACLEPLGLSVTEGAKVLGVTRQTLTKIINGKSGISAEMAIRLGESVLAAQQTFGYACRPLMILPRSATDESKIKVRRQHMPQELAAQ